VLTSQPDGTRISTPPIDHDVENRFLAWRDRREAQIQLPPPMMAVMSPPGTVTHAARRTLLHTANIDNVQTVRVLRRRRWWRAELLDALGTNASPAPNGIFDRMRSWDRRSATEWTIGTEWSQVQAVHWGQAVRWGRTVHRTEAAERRWRVPPVRNKRLNPMSIKITGQNSSQMRT
jgi:hypothetical protein